MPVEREQNKNKDRVRYKTHGYRRVHSYRFHTYRAALTKQRKKQRSNATFESTDERPSTAAVAYQMYFNTVAVLVLTDVPGPLPFVRYGLADNSFRGAASSPWVVRPTTAGLIIAGRRRICEWNFSTSVDAVPARNTRRYKRAPADDDDDDQIHGNRARSAAEPRDTYDNNIPRVKFSMRRHMVI